MITFILVELDMNRNILSYKEKEFKQIDLSELNNWVDIVKFGVLNNAYLYTLNNYGGAIIRNGAILIKERRKKLKEDLSFYNTDNFLFDIEQKLEQKIR